MEDKNLISVLRRGLEVELFPDGMTAENIDLLNRVERTLSKSFKAGYKSAQLFSSVEWSNNACLGYVILGARNLDYKENQIKEIVRSTYCQFDFKTIEEAKRVYETSPY